MSKLKDLIGHKFGKLTVIEYSHSNNGAFWVCECECGNIVIRSGGVLQKSKKDGFESSCGCGTVIHGMINSLLYNIWINMKQRCNNPNRKDYQWYGAKGISYDPSWEKFDNFYADVKNQYEDFCNKNLDIIPSLDRKDYTKNYELSNIHFIPYEEQNHNKSSNKVNYELANEIREDYATGNYTKVELSKKYNLSESFTGKIINKKVWYKENS
jgi:hypothetical protein